MNDVNTFINKPLLLIMAVCMLCMGCKKNNQICGPNTHLVSDTCLCNTGWIGADCSVPAYKLAGTYHMVGTSHTSSLWGDSTIQVDEMLDVMSGGDTLYAGSKAYLYYESASDSANSYLFYWNGNSLNYARLYFIKSNDSLYYYTRSGGNMGTATTSLSGIKVQ